MVGGRVVLREGEVRELVEDLERVLGYALERMRELPFQEKGHEECRKLCEALVNTLYKALYVLDEWARKRGEQGDR